jgi:hypothetical protein
VANFMTVKIQEHEALYDDQAHFLIFARDLGIEITI